MASLAMDEQLGALATAFKRIALTPNGGTLLKTMLIGGCLPLSRLLRCVCVRSFVFAVASLAVVPTYYSVPR